MKKEKIEGIFLNEKVMNIISFLAIIFGIISLGLTFYSDSTQVLLIFEKLIKIVITILTIRAFSKYHWDAMKGMIGGLLFALLYQESFLVLGKLWGETSDFDMYLIMGVEGSLYLSAESMSFLMTVIIIINHFVIDYSRMGNIGNVIFNQLSIFFKIILYISLMIINIFLNQPGVTLVTSAFEYLSDLCIVILIICIETQLDSFKAIRQELLTEKKQHKERSHHE